MEKFLLEEYLSCGVERIVKGILKTSFLNPKESAFMLQYAQSEKAARGIRHRAEKEGLHIPPFLIASITSQCNLHCQGCYARANQSCRDEQGAGQLSQNQWGTIFSDAEELGIGFILLAGGEPLIRKDVLLEASLHNKILFPVFTNGTLLNDTYIQLFFENRNLVPIFSIEGNEIKTDERRGSGIHQLLLGKMKNLKSKGILFGASITVTSKNLEEVMSDKFTDDLALRGCKAAIYVEYVPVDGRTQNLALGDADRIRMKQCLVHLREKRTEMLYISFPGDEKTSGGCLAAGRGFFHINAYGGAEPCPFSPYSDSNLTEIRLEEALHSPLFLKLQSDGILTAGHQGGCVLYERQKEVEAILK